MKSILLRDIPEVTLERLKSRAQRHRRSLQGELRTLLEWAASLPANVPAALDIKTVCTKGDQNWSREAIYED